MPILYGNTPTLFGGKPVTSTAEMRGLDVVTLGIPWEGAITWGSSSGCELAPKIMRQMGARYFGFLPEYDIDIHDYLTLGDYGDVEVTNQSTEATWASARVKIRDILSAGAIPLVMGGDHAIPIPVVQALGDFHAGKRIGIIQYDAHYDNWDEFQGDHNARNTPMRRIAEVPGVRPDRIVQIGIRGPRNARGGAEYARKSGAKVYTMREIAQLGMNEVTRQAIDLAHDGTDLVYVTVDSDVLDAAFNPGGPPDPAGINSLELICSLYEVGKAGIAGADVVEIYPGIDPGNKSAHAMCWAMLYLLGGVAERKRSR